MMKKTLYPILIFIFCLFFTSCSYSQVYRYFYHKADDFAIKRIQQLLPSIRDEQIAVVREGIRQYKKNLERTKPQSLLKLVDDIEQTVTRGLQKDGVERDIVLLRKLQKQLIADLAPVFARFFLILDTKQKQDFFANWSNNTTNVAEKQEQIQRISKSWIKNLRFVLGPINKEQTQIINSYAQQFIDDADVRRIQQQSRWQQLYKKVNEVSSLNEDKGFIQLRQELRQWLIANKDDRWWATIAQILQSCDSQQRVTLMNRLSETRKFIRWLETRPTI